MDMARFRKTVLQGEDGKNPDFRLAALETTPSSSLISGRPKTAASVLCRFTNRYALPVHMASLFFVAIREDFPNSLNREKS